MSDMEKIRAEIGARIKARRLELYMTQEELAAKVGFKGKTSIAKMREQDAARLDMVSLL